MSELRDLYQEVILDHGKSPRNRKKLEDANHEAQGYNPLCGDKISIAVKVENGRVVDVAFQGAGCAISTASASMMTEAVKGKTIEEARELVVKAQDRPSVGSWRIMIVEDADRMTERHSAPVDIDFRFVQIERANDGQGLNGKSFV